jgi:signal transduction histidine kinase
MEPNQDISTICVATFSRIAASISHEIKNTLSIINENAGLLDDLAAMSGDEGCVPGDRVKAATTSIIRQVARSNLIMKNLNRFAHSGDVPIARIDVEETLALAVALSARQAAMRQVTVNHASPTALDLQTNPQVLLSLLFNLLCHIFQQLPADSELVVEAAKAGDRITFKIRLNPPSTAPIATPESQELLLLDHLQATLIEDPAAFGFSLPTALRREH